MLRHRHWLQATSLCLGVASCATPIAGTTPTGTTALAPAAPVALPVAPAAPVVVPSLAPAPPTTADARQRLAGSVVFNDAPVANASLTAIDLATGQALTLKAWSEAGSGATGTQRTDARGTFDLELPKLGGDQLVKLVAVSGARTYTALFDARGRAVGGAGALGASYKLAQGQAVSVTIRLKLTAATTAAAKAFEGALKLTFQLPKEAREAERAAALAAADEAARQVEAALAVKPELAQDLVVSVGANGEVQDVDAFRSAVAKLGVFDTVFEAVQGRLQALTALKLTAEGTLDALTAEDFPLDRVTITPGGGLTFTGGQAALGGALTSHFVPTPGRTQRRAETSAPALPSAPVDEAADEPFTGEVQDAAGLAIYGYIPDAPSLSYHTLASSYMTSSLYLFDEAGAQVASTTLTSGITGLGALPASTTIMVTSSSRGILRFRRNGDGTYTEEASGSVGVMSVGGAVAGGRYWAFSRGSRHQIRSWPLTGNLDDAASQTVQLNGSDLEIGSALMPYNPGDAHALAVQADGTATHIYWIDQSRQLFRISQVGANTTAELIFTFSGLGAFGAVAAAGPTLYAAAGGWVYRIPNPTAHWHDLQIDPIASYPGLVTPPGQVPQGAGPRGGAQQRPGSVVFGFYLSGRVQRFKVSP